MRFATLICLFSSSLVLAQPNQPKLVVGVVVDQMCYDYLYRFYDQFGENGFKRLMNQGSHFRNVTYNYVPTYTGPGHASIYTGTTPSNHGIVANDWYDSEFQQEIYCVNDSMVRSIGNDSPDGKRSPQYLRANTITDQLKLTYPQGKVISISIKDRSAILPAGHTADGAYWYDFKSGKFITSSFYMNQVSTWVSSFYGTNPIENYLKLKWDLLLSKENYHYRDLDNSPYEQLLGGKTTPTFPYDFTALPLTNQLENFTGMPFANTYLTDFALSALKNEQLGTDKHADVLAISYSTPDIAGHAFGPYSLEMEDMYIRLDKEIERLLSELDKQVGKQNYVFFLTADHAVVPVPQYLTDKKLPGGYLFLSERLAELRKASVQKFQKDVIDRIENNNVYLKKELLHTPELEDINLFLQHQIEQWPEVKAVFTQEQLQGNGSENQWLKMVQDGFEAKRSGEVIFLLQPGFLPKSSDSQTARKGTSHGSAFNYDTHVPVLFYGAGIPKQEIFTPYEITDIAASLVHILHLQRPNAMTGKPMIELFGK